MSATMIQQPAPNFKAEAVLANGEFGEISLSDYKDNKYVVLFFYPLDFTFVCPTELHAFQAKLADFESKNTQVIGCSVDSWFSHQAWLSTPKAKGGIQGITYPILSDFNKTISKDYDVLNEELGASYRGLFLIDKEGIVRHQLINDLPLGRSVDEALRMLDALQFFEANGEVCPANWKQGEKSMQADTEGLEAYFADAKETITVS